MKTNSTLKKHIKEKQVTLKDLCIPKKIIDTIPWDDFATITQVDNYCRKVINDFFDDKCSNAHTIKYCEGVVFRGKSYDRKKKTYD